MPTLDGVQLDQLGERRGTDAHVLLWIRARNRSSGLPEEIGFWTGDDHRQIQIGAELRSYFGAGDVIDVAPVKAGIGLAVRQHRVTLPPLVDEVAQMLRGYEPRLAEVELHLCLLDIDSANLLGAPVRMIRGVLNEAPETLGGKGGESRLELVIASSARKLTFGLPLLRSNAELARRNPADRGREYSDVAGDWTVPWGQA